MNKSKWMTMAAVLTMSASLAIAAPHGGKMGPGKHGGAEMADRMAEKLNLTDAQKQQIQELRKSFRDQHQAFFEQAARTREQFRAAREAGNTAELESLKAVAKAQREQMKQLRDEHMEQVMSLLTPEQRTQWEAMKAEHKGRRDGHRRGHGRGQIH